MRKIVLILLILVGAVLGFVAFRSATFGSASLGLDMSEITRVYGRYVIDHNGVMPDSFQDLVGGRYFRMEARGGYVVLHGPRPEPGEFIPEYSDREITTLDKFEITYSGAVAELECRDGRVFKGGSHEEIIFVRPMRSSLTEMARRYTTAIVNKAEQFHSDSHIRNKGDSSP